MLLVLGGTAAALDGRPRIEGVARFVDADTLDIGDIRIRLHGIDAPEMAERCTDARGREWRCGVWATDVARARFQGRVLSCADLGERTHGRVVARCTDGADDVALALVREGVVMACPRYALEHDHSRAYLDAEKLAAFDGAGLHAGPLNPRAGFCEPRNTAPGAVTGVSQPIAAEAHSGCAIKGNVNRNGDRIYHMPGQRNYDDVRMNSPEKRWFCSEAEARAAGWRPAQR